MRLLAVALGFAGCQGLYQADLHNEEAAYAGLGWEGSAWPVGPGTESMPCTVSVGRYTGVGWHKAGQTDGRRCLFQSQQEWVEVHSRHRPSGFSARAPRSTVLWLNQPDRVHVLAHLVLRDKFVVLNRGGYALDGLSYEVANGHVGEQETPALAAERVLTEVLRMPEMSCGEPQQLGRHRADSERGMGWIFSFVADCRLTSEAFQQGEAEEPSSEEPAQVVHLGRMQLRQAVAEGRFGEAKWSNSAALALLHAQAEAWGIRSRQEEGRAEEEQDASKAVQKEATLEAVEETLNAVEQTLQAVEQGPGAAPTSQQAEPREWIPADALGEGPAEPRMSQPLIAGAEDESQSEPHSADENEQYPAPQHSAHGESESIAPRLEGVPEGSASPRRCASPASLLASLLALTAA